MAIGAPGSNSVSTYYQHPDGYWERVPKISASNSSNVGDSSAFGCDMGFVYNMSKYTTPFLIVGASDTADGGSAFLYAFIETAKSWKLVGTPLTAVGDSEDVINSKFGSAVAVSENLRVVVGAPRFGVENRGRVFTFEYKPVGVDQSLPSNEYEWTAIASATITGSSADSGCGRDLDMTPDGEILIIGEPNENNIAIYHWVEDEKSWAEEFSYQSASEHIDFGSSVVFLSSTHVAVGAPSAYQNAGQVSLFQKDLKSGLWSFLKSIQGEASGDRIGAKGTVSGSQGPWGTQVVVSTHKGLVQRHDLVVVGSSTYLLVERFTVNIASATSIDVEADEDGFVIVAGYGGSDLALLYGPPYESVSTPTEAPKSPSSKEIQGELVGATKSASYGYGASVALAGGLVAVGDPSLFHGAGAAELFRVTSEWTNVETIVNSGSQEFGSAIAFRQIAGKCNLLVGAKATRQDFASLANYGSAHYFELDDTTNSWTHVGQTLYPEFQLAEAGGEFGAAVAMSSSASIRRIAIGAPSSSIDTFIQDNGRVYTFEYGASSWQPRTAALVGGAGNFFGSAVDLMSDGSRLLVGAPGGDKAFYYRWKEEAEGWDEVFVAKGERGEAFGSSAAVVDDDGSVIAIGGPVYGNGRGVVRLYSQYSSDGSFHQMGSDIVGSDGEGIGTTLCGTKGIVAFGTNKGHFRVYSLSGSEWKETAHGGFAGSRVVSIALSENAETLVLGLENGEVWIYALS